MHGSVLIHPPLVAGPAIFLHPFKSTQNVPLTSRARGVHQAYAWRPAGCSDEFRRYKPVSETLLDLKSRTENLLGFAWVPLRKFRSSSGRFPGQPQFVRKAYVVNGRQTAPFVISEFLRLGVLSAKPRPVRFEVPGSTAANPKPRNVGYSSKTGAQQVLRRFRETRLRCGFSRCGCYRRNRNVKDQRSSTACEW